MTPRFRLSRFEIALVTAVAATSFLCIGLARAGQRAVKERGESSTTLQKEAFDPKIFRERILQNPGLKQRAEMASLGILAVMFGSLCGMVRLVLRVFKGLPLVEPLGAPHPACWTLRGIIHLALGVLLLAQWLMLTEAGIILMFHPAWLDRHLLSLGNTLAIDAVLIIWVYILAFRRNPTPPLIGEKNWRNIRFGIGSYVASLPLFFLLMMLVGMVLQLLHREPTPQPIFSMYLKETRAGVVTTLLLLVAVIGPMAEELFFRGLLYGWLRSRIGIWKGLLVSGFLFATLHMDAVTFLPIAGLGILLGWVYEQTGSLAAPIAVHIFHNAGMMFLASIVKSILSG